MIHVPRDYIKDAVAWCSHKSRAKEYVRSLGTHNAGQKHPKSKGLWFCFESIALIQFSTCTACVFPCSRDKYSRQIREYWVDVQTVGKFRSTEQEEITDRTSVEGVADHFVLGGVEPGPGPMNLDGSASEAETDDDGSDSGNDGSRRGCKRRVKPEDVEEERALEALYGLEGSYMG